jgi:hypothetical protein
MAASGDNYRRSPDDLGSVSAMPTWRRAVILAASCCDLAAGAVTIWWSLPGYVAGLLFALLFLVAAVLLAATTFKGSIRLLVTSLVLTVIAELEPVGGVMASAILRQSPGLGSVLPLGVGALSIVGMATVC